MFPLLDKCYQLTVMTTALAGDVVAGWTLSEKL
jgi:hypothetical protein